jgi:hypothetical protein
VIDGGAAFNLFALDLLEKEIPKEVIDESGVDARHPPGPEASAGRPFTESV